MSLSSIKLSLYLSNNKWLGEYKYKVDKDNYRTYYVDISFDVNTHYYQVHMQDVMNYLDDEGIYEIKNNRLLFVSKNQNEIINNGILKYDKNNFEYNEFIIFDNGAYINNLNSIIKNNTQVKYDNIKFITKNSLEYELKNNETTRESPSISSKIIKFYEFIPSPPSEDPNGEPPPFSLNELDYVPAKTEIYILGQSINSYLINNETKYLYYVKIPGFLGSIPYRCWIYSNFNLE